MKNSIFYLALLLASCSQPDTASQELPHVRHEHDVAHEAQAHMHRNSIPELIMHFNDSSRLSWQKPELVMQALGELDGKVVADIGAGSGYFTFLLARQAKKVLAVDIEQDFLNYIQAAADSLQLDNIQQILANENSPEIKEPVDLILIVNTYHHIQDRIGYFKELGKRISEGGELCIVDFKKELPEKAPGPPHRMRMSSTQVQQELASAGYTQKSTDTTTLPYQYILKFKFQP